MLYRVPAKNHTVLKNIVLVTHWVKNVPLAANANNA